MKILSWWVPMIGCVAQAVDYVAWLILRILGTDLTLKECLERVTAYSESKRTLPEVSAPEDVLSYCEGMLADARKRLEHITDKAKVLLTIGIFSSGLMLGLFSYAKPVGILLWFLYLSPVLFALISFFLVFFYLGMSRYQTPKLGDKEATLESKKLKISRAESILSCVDQVNAVCDFLGTVYIAARRALAIAWIILVFASVYSSFNTPKESTEQKHYRELTRIVQDHQATLKLQEKALSEARKSVTVQQILLEKASQALNRELALIQAEKDMLEQREKRLDHDASQLEAKRVLLQAERKSSEEQRKVRPGVIPNKNSRQPAD